MPEKPTKREGKLTEVETKGPPSEVDRLIAETEAAAAEAQRVAVSKEIETTQAKKKVSAEAAGRAEQLQQWFSALKANDAFVEDYGYEWVFDAAEAETGVAAPEKIREILEALRKSGEALRKLGAVEPKSDALLRKMEELQKLHDQTFDQVQTATTDALDAVKKKFKGEETEFERRYKELSESPLVRGVEFDPHSPEAREKALKQEITEFLMRPLIESRLQPLEKRIIDTKGQLAKLQEESSRYRSAEYGVGDQKNANYYATEAARKLGLLPAGQREIQAYELRGLIDRKIEGMNEQVNALEIQLARERLAFEVNRTVIEESIRDEHDETTMREGMVGLRTYLGELRKNAERTGGWEDWTSGAPTPKSKVAQKILGQYQQYAVSMPEGHTYELSSTLGIRATFPAEQLLGASASRTGYERGNSAAEYLRGQSRLDFLKLRLGEEIDDKEVFRLLMPHEKDLTPKLIQSLYEEGPQLRTPEAQKLKEKLFQKFPAPDALINRIFGEQGRLFNLRRAYQKIDEGLRGEKKPTVAAMPKELAEAGWKESKSGGFVEPGQNVREVDGEYARLLERLSKSQIDAERAFDVRGPEGEFHVYTTEQAVSLLRRARRDARDIVRDSERAVAEIKMRIEGDKTGKEGLEAQVKRLSGQLDTARKTATAREEELGERLTRERDEAVRRAQREGNERLTAETARSQETVRGILAQLKGALKKKPGLLGGEKELRETVEALVRQLEGK